MQLDESVFSNEERIAFKLRALYRQSGFQQYKMSKFEEYDLYAGNRDFLVSDRILSFHDPNGKLMALKPDVTLSIVRSLKAGPGEVRKVYYNENVYRVPRGASSFREILQAGLECIGDLDASNSYETLLLANRSLRLISRDSTLNLSHMGLVNELLLSAGLDEAAQKQAVGLIGAKNMHELRRFLNGTGTVSEEQLERLLRIFSLCGSPREVLEALRKEGCDTPAVDELSALCGKLSEAGEDQGVLLDLSVVNDMSYYSGLLFKGYLCGVPQAVLCGGAYDKLLLKMGLHSRAIGFAVYLDFLERYEENRAHPDERVAQPCPDADNRRMLNIALPKGRLGETVYGLFEAAGYECRSIHEKNRKLIFENQEKGLRFFWVKPSDVHIYVERGAADIGVVGKDILLEYEPDVYELLDLGIGRCMMAEAVKEGYTDRQQYTKRVATKYEKIARAYYASLGREIDIIRLNGSIELAPILGLSDVIVDIVETGTTLRENRLCVTEKIVDISARLIANKSSWNFKRKVIEEIAGALAGETGAFATK